MRQMKCVILMRNTIRGASGMMAIIVAEVEVTVIAVVEAVR